jgi:phosphoglycerate dehydrogenase-like enzyme
MRQLRATVPDESMLERLRGVVPEVQLSVWRPDSGPGPGAAVDLAVLPYMVGPDYLAHLDGRPVRIIQSQMLGHDRVDELLPAGMTYCNAVRVHESSTAELAIALVLASQRGLSTFRDQQAERRWSRFRTPGLLGARVLVVGAGGVGQQVAARLAGFEADVQLVARTSRASTYGPVLAMGAIWDELPKSDVVILAVPLTDETRGLADARFLGAMRDGALLVNVARGPVVDTDALVREVAAGRLRAALDVVDPEPLPAEHPLWSLDSVLISPHVGGETESMTAAVDRLIVGQLRRLVAGKAPEHVVCQR